MAREDETSAVSATDGRKVPELRGIVKQTGAATSSSLSDRTRPQTPPSSIVAESFFHVPKMKTWPDVVFDIPQITNPRPLLYREHQWYTSDYAINLKLVDRDDFDQDKATTNYFDAAPSFERDFTRAKGVYSEKTDKLYGEGKFLEEMEWLWVQSEMKAISFAW